MTLGYQENSQWKGFDILCNHARLNRPEMNKVVKNAFYFTIIRHPVDHFDSVWGYFKFYRYFFRETDDSKNNIPAMKIFLDDPEFYFGEFGQSPSAKHFRNFIWNGQLFDLGVNQDLFENLDYINDAIQQLSKDLNLVLIKEYFDESMILMKNHLCLSYEDIIYLPQNMRKDTEKLSPSLKRVIESWNRADMIMYDYFNRTFWERIHKYGQTFFNDLKLFRELNSNVTDECATDLDDTDRDTPAIFSTTFPRLRCADLHKVDTQNTELIRIMTRHRLNIKRTVIGYPT